LKEVFGTWLVSLFFLPAGAIVVVVVVVVVVDVVAVVVVDVVVLPSATKHNLSNHL
jgi:hypothetical protein